MSIYSANRSGSMALTQGCANESYKSNDMARILYETEMNDMAFFNAILVSDFREIRGLREGTILESEVAGLNEASARTFFASMKERLKRFWEKIKGAFKDAVNKIAAYVFRDGKAFVKSFWSTYNKYNGWTGTIKDVKRWEVGTSPIRKMESVSAEMEKDIKGIVNGTNKALIDKDKNDILKKYLAKVIGQPANFEPSEFTSKYMDAFEETMDIDSSVLPACCTAIENGKKHIDAIKKAEKNAKNTVDKVGKLLTEAENKIDSENSGKNISTISMMVSVAESYVTYVSKASIASVKADVKSLRAALGSVLADLRSNGKKKEKDKVFFNSAILEAEAELDEIENTDIDVDFDTDDQDEIMSIASDDND